MEFEHQPRKTLISKILVIHHIVICFSFFFNIASVHIHVFFFQFSTDHSSIFYTSMHTFLFNFIYLHFWIVLARTPWESGVALNFPVALAAKSTLEKKKSTRHTINNSFRNHDGEKAGMSRLNPQTNKYWLRFQLKVFIIIFFFVPKICRLCCC